MNNGDSDARRAAREFLTEEYKAFTDSLEKNEQRGETRVNWFIGIVVGSAGGLAKIFAEGKLTSWPLRLVTVAALLGLLAFGYVTFCRIIKRDQTSDELKDQLLKIRKLFQRHFNGDVLKGYAPFEKQAKHGDRKRSFGGLADLVLSINSLLAAALAAVPFVPGRSFSWQNAESLGQLAVAGILGTAGFALAFFAQRRRVTEMKPSHAGGVVYRSTNGALQFLLVGPKKEKSGEWILPKGHIEDRETPEETALREVREETGVTARTICPLDAVVFKAEDNIVRAIFYLMELISEVEPTEKRRRAWFSFDDAIVRASHPETRALLKKAATRLKAKLRARVSTA
jgi:8-oxo-dGTP pyrophosphatase MutT (NUDIX family)